MEDWMHNANRVEMVTIGMETTINTLRKKVEGLNLENDALKQKINELEELRKSAALNHHAVLDVIHREYQTKIEALTKNSSSENASYARGVADTLRKLNEAEEASKTVIEC